MVAEREVSGAGPPWGALARELQVVAQPIHGGDADRVVPQVACHTVGADDDVAFLLGERGFSGVIGEVLGVGYAVRRGDGESAERVVAALSDLLLDLGEEAHHQLGPVVQQGVEVPPLEAAFAAVVAAAVLPELDLVGIYSELREVFGSIHQSCSLHSHLPSFGTVRSLVKRFGVIPRPWVVAEGASGHGVYRHDVALNRQPNDGYSRS